MGGGQEGALACASWRQAGMSGGRLEVEGVFGSHDGGDSQGQTRLAGAAGAVGRGRREASILVVAAGGGGPY